MLQREDLTPAEASILDGFNKGMSRFRSSGSALDPKADVLPVRFELIAALVSGRGPLGAGRDPGGILIIENTRLTGLLDLTHLDCDIGLAMDRCWLDSGSAADLWGARLPHLELTNSRIDSDFSALGLKVGQNVNLTGSTFNGRVLLSGAMIGGSLGLNNSSFMGRMAPTLDFSDSEIGTVIGCEMRTNGTVSFTNARIDGGVVLSGAHLDGRGSTALLADHVTVRGKIDLSKGFTATGGVSLSNADVGAGVELDTANLRADEAPALNLENTRIAGSLFMNDGFRAASCSNLGAVRLHGTVVTHQLMLNSAVVSGSSIALWADNLTVGQDFLTAGNDNTEEVRFANGSVSMIGARVGGQSNLSGLRFANSDRKASILLNAYDHSVADVLFLPVTPIPGVINLSGAACRSLVASGSLQTPTLLRGFRYGDAPELPMNLARWIAWISRDPVGLVPSSYAQLASALRNSGHPDSAELVMIYMERERWSIRRSWWAALISLVLRLTTGYGYRPWRALACLVLLMLVGTLAIQMLHDGYGLVEALDPGGFKRSSDGPATPFNAFLYASACVLAFLPSLQSGWIPVETPSIVVAYALNTLGYVLAVAVLAALAASVRRN